MTIRRAGRMHHLHTGTTHARKRVLALADDHHITVTELTTGEVLSTHLIEPEQDLLAQPKERARPLAELPKVRPMSQTSGETYVPTHHMSAGGGTRTPKSFRPPAPKAGASTNFATPA